MPENTPRIEKVNVGAALQSFMGTYQGADGGESLKKWRKEQWEFIYKDCWLVAPILAGLGFCAGLIITLLVSGVWSLIDANSIKESFEMVMKVGALYIGAGSGTLLFLYLYINTIRYLYKNRGLKRSDRDQKFIDDPIHLYAAKIVRLVEKYNQRAKRWSLIAKGVDTGVMAMTDRLQEEYEVLQEVREEMSRCLNAAEFLLEWKEEGYDKQSSSDFSGLLDELRDSQSRLDSLLEIDVCETVSIEQMPSLPDLVDEELQLKRTVAAKVASGH